MSFIAFNPPMNSRDSTFGTERVGKLQEDLRQQISAAIVEQACNDTAAALDQAELMQILRRAKAEAALLIALADIGNVWPVKRVTAALTEIAEIALRAAVNAAIKANVAIYTLDARGLEAQPPGGGAVTASLRGQVTDENGAVDGAVDGAEPAHNHHQQELDRQDDVEGIGRDEFQLVGEQRAG